MKAAEKVALATLLSAMWTAPAYAQEGRNLSDTLSIEEAVVSSLKIERCVEDVPSSINVTTSLEVKKSASPTVADALRREPGLSKGSDGVWATNINVRGLSENRLVTLVDNYRIETATDLTASLSMVNVNDIERIEVIKGAQSSIYGSGAIGGIINIITKDGHFAETPYFNGSVSAGFSSANTSHGEYVSLYGGGKKWYIKASGAFGHGENLLTPQGVMDNSGFTTTDFGARAGFRPAQGHTLKFEFQRNFSHDVGIPGGAAFSPTATATYKRIGRTLLSAGYEIANLTDSFEKLELKAYLQSIERDVEMLPNAARPETGAMPVKVTPYALHTTFGGSAQGTWKFNAGNTFTAGAEFWRRNVFTDRNKYIDQYSAGEIKAQMIRNETPIPRSSFTSAGIYAQDEMRFIDNRLILTFGGRFDLNFVQNEECHNVECIENVTTGTVNPEPPGKFVTFAAGSRATPSWSYNAGLLYKATDRFDLVLNATRSYRSPSLEELYKFIDLAGNKVHFGNPDLKPENGIGGDLGARLHGGNLEFGVSLFVNCINDMIVERKVNTVQESDIDTLVLDNASKALLYGFDLNVSYSFASRFKAYLNASWTIGMETASQWLPMIPPANGILGISYENRRILGARIEMAAAGARTANQIAEGERPTDAWCRLDFAVNSKIFNLGRCNLQIFGGIDNITNATYTNFLATNRGNITCEAARNFYIKANFTF